METHEAFEHGGHGATHPGVLPGRTFPVRIDEDQVLLHEQRPTGEALLASVDKRPCAYKLIQLLKHDEKRTIAPTDTVDLAAPGIDRFITERKEVVDITINGNPYQIQRGNRTVAEILVLVGQTPDAYALLEEKDGPPLPLPANQPVHIEGCEVFHTQVQSGASS